MRFWDYFPHPFKHPAWFSATLTIVGGLTAGLCGYIDIMCAIVASGLLLAWLHEIVKFFYHEVDRPGWAGLLIRCWLKASIVWACVYGAVWFENPAYDEYQFTMLIPGAFTLLYLWYFDH